MSGKIPVFNMTLPAEGPITLPQNVDLQTDTEKELDLTQAINDKHISFIAGAWIDNSENAQDVTIQCSGTNQRIKFPASSQGWVAMHVTNPPKFNISQAAPDGIVHILFTNFPVFPYIWTP